MFEKLLIANRGEIALRINRTAQRLGIPTVAVYSDADKYSPHVTACNEAVCIGPPPPRDSYLNMEAILEACRATGADAVHPGYGFLSEKAAFAETVAAAGMTFVGPPADVIALMGDKIVANRTADAAGVSTVPGHRDVIASPEAAVEIGQAIGYPVMLKAAAGGGGKGMRIARTDDDLREAFRVASSEAVTAFGDARVFIEKYIERPRHIEIQILADGAGTTLYLGERECSIQRRHQKVIEEAPSPFVTPELRRAMGEQAAALATAVGYRSAGTVEFVVDQSGAFYFLEMNTRLQVEHSVTEFITGLDLVEWMLRIAAGEALPFQQHQIDLTGWAIETRVYAEDPNRGFLPSTGRLVRYRMPTDSRDVRVDSGVYEGGEISLFYDPMIAKVTTWGRNRATAVESLRLALDEVYIEGVRHNVAFLSALLAHPRFLVGDTNTNLIADEYPDGFSPAPLEAQDLNDIIASAVLMHLRHVFRASQAGGQMPGFHKRMPAEWEVRVGETFYPVRMAPAPVGGSEEGFELVIDGHDIAIRSAWQVGDPVLDCTINARPRAFKVLREGLGYRLFHLGAEVDVMVFRADVAQFAKRMPKRKSIDLSQFLVSPMPGLLRSVAVAVGEKVNPGDELAVVEAMKMENVLKASRAGRVAEIMATPGDTLAVGQTILAFE